MKSTDKLRKLFDLSAVEMRTLITAFFWLTTFRLGLLVIPFNKFRKLLARILPDASEINQASDEKILSTISQVVWAINATSRHHLFTFNCFPRALTAHVLLRRRGVLSTIQIGVARDDEGVFEAHAWVEYHGQIVIGKLEDMTRFIPLPRLNEKLA